MATLDLQAILDAATAGGQNTPDERAAAVKAALNADGVARADIDALLDNAIEKFGQLNAEENLDADGVNGLELLGEVITTARTVQTDLDTAEAEVRAKREELAAKVLGADDPAAEPGDGDETPDDNSEPGEAAAESTEPAQEAVAASAQPRPRFDLGRIKNTAPAPEVKPAGLAITAAAGVRGVENGSNLDMDGLTAAVAARIDGMPRGTTGAYVRDGVAQIKIDFPDELVASGKNDQDVLDYAGDQSRIDDGLVASGGWCAPSETLYELAPMLADPNAGLADVPDIQVKRGGIRTTEGVSFAAVWAGDAGLVQTEAQAEANTIKTLYRPTCPTFTETRLDVIYSGIIVGFLQNNAYPEVTRDAIAGVTAVHAHRVNAETIKRMAALSTAVDLTGKIGPSATGSVLNGLALQIVDARYKDRAPESLVYDVVLPMWAKEAVRADYALRGGIPLEQVTAAQITSWIAQRGGRVQWVYDWQDSFTTSPAAGFGGAAAITEYPASVEALVYPSGTFVRGRGEVINLDTVYDSTMTKSNDYLQMFMEEKILVRKRAYSSRKVKLALGVNGTVGAAQVLDGNGKIVPATP
ncbi:major capsid protein [Gordonia sp. (in: high G+C Gram-positive bacteria)]|uniref:major capsid protein n=1 Tax=Gordonia sp. (in: high G+C Gram-positive bacteria) TaxID=84139 RepID=UPI00262721BA|nr:major capsid protein [Gordonia sp. (in: high G+C Gram-positive bacteria)]